MSLTKVTNSMISGSPANVLDYGAVGDGSTDSTTAIQAALDAASATTFRDVLLPAGNFIISETLTIPEGVTLRGQGNRTPYALGTEGLPSSITKVSTMAGTAIKLSGKRSCLSNLGVFSEAGATGDGIWIAANYCRLSHVASNGHSVAGIRIGAIGAGALNCNAWYLDHVTASYNGSHGVIVDDQFTAYPLNDANAGTYISGELRSNGDDGLFVGNCFGNTFIGILTEANTGYGMYFDNESTKHVVIGGDQDEANTVGVIYNNGTYNQFYGILSSGFTDAGTYTNMLGYTTNSFVLSAFPAGITVPTATFTPQIDGTTAAGIGTYTAQVGTYTKVGNRVFFTVYLAWSAHTGTGNMQVSNLPFTASAFASTHPVAMSWDGLTFSGVIPTAAVLNATKIIRLYNAPASGAANALLAMDTAASITISGSYEAAP